MPGGGGLRGVREQLGKLGGSLMILASSAALTYFIYIAAQGAPQSYKGEPSPHLTYPLWPQYLCIAIVAVGGVLYGWARRWRLPPWETRRALTRRAAAAERRATSAETALARALEELEARNTSSTPEQERLRVLLVKVIHYRQW